MRHSMMKYDNDGIIIVIISIIDIITIDINNDCTKTKKNNAEFDI